MENEAMKLDSSCWNSQTCLDNCEWIAENIKGIDQSVKEMLQLIEHDADSKVDGNNNNLKQPELIARVKEISHRHHMLADHYKVTGELSKSASKTKNNDKTALDSQLTPPFLTPMNNKLRTHDAEDSDLSLSTGDGISDITPNEGSQSSFSSDTDSEAYYTIRNERSGLFSSNKTMKYEIIKMSAEILEYKKEHNIYNEKLMFAEEEIAKFKKELRNNEAEIMSARNRIKLQEAEIEKENERSFLNLQSKIVDLETELELEKKKYTVDLSDRDCRIKKLNTEFQDASGNLALEKWQLESTVSKLSDRLNELQIQFDSLAGENKKCKSEKAEMEKKQEALRITWVDDIMRVKNEISEKNELISSLNENLDGFKLRYDLLMAEKDGVIAKVQTLGAEISCRDDLIRRLEKNQKELHSENEQLSQLCESGNKLTCELESRIEELEKEAGMKAIVISDMAEGKREAIRQLCFSIDHFRCAYEEVRYACVARVRAPPA